MIMVTPSWIRRITRRDPLKSNRRTKRRTISLDSKRRTTAQNQKRASRNVNWTERIKSKRSVLSNWAFRSTKRNSNYSQTITKGRISHSTQMIGGKILGLFRFQAIYDKPEFAIDPTDRHFKKETISQAFQEQVRRKKLKHND